MAKKRRLSPEEKRRRELKIRFKPLFDEFYHLSSVKQVDDSLGTHEQAPLSFLQIKQKFQNSTYNNVKQIVDDMRRVTSGISRGETVSEAARKLELYIERTIEPIEKAEDILELYQLHRSTCIQLDSNHSLGKAESPSADQFHYSSHMDRMKMSLRWPLPAVPDKTDPYLKATANLSRKAPGASARSLSSAQSLPTIAEEPTATTPGGSTWSKKTFEIEGVRYKVAITPWPQTLKFSICIKADNELGRLNFVSEHVDRFLKSDFSPIKQNKPAPLPNSQTSEDEALDEGTIRSMLEKYLYQPTQKLVLRSLDHHKDHFSGDFMEIIQDRPYVSAPEAAGGIQLEAKLLHEQKDPLFFGLSFKPDSKLAYYANVRVGSDPTRIPMMMPVIFTGVVEVKYITFRLGECIKDLKVCRRINGDLPNVEPDQRSRIKEVEDTLYKYTTYCVYLGLPRFALSDYNGYFLAQLEFESDNPPDGYGSGKAEITSSGIGEYIKVRYSYFTREDPYIRLLLPSFFSMSDKYVNEIERFRKLVKTKLQEQRYFAEVQQQQQRANQSADGTGGTAGGTADTAPGTGGQTGQGSDQAGDRNRRAEEYNLRSTSIFNENSNDTNGIFTPPTSSPRATPSYHPDVIPLEKESKHGVSQVNSGSQSNRPLTFDESLFKDPSYVELGNVITDFIAVGPRIAQVVQVQTRNCQRQLFPENMVEDSDLPEKSVMKVYDPYHGVLTQYDPIEGEVRPIHYSYQRGIDYTIAEVKAYCALRGCGFTPRLIAYGRISDLYPAVGELYLALCGGYLMLEQLDDDEHFVINKDFYEAKIVPVYRALHGFNILHGDVKRQNVCITEGNFMLIDFSHASFSSDERKKDAEMLVVKETFSRVEWG